MLARQSAPARLDQLTSLRFFAALAVLSSHLWMLEELPGHLQPLARTIFHEGYAGVGFFFMLSGFILAHTYQAALRARTIPAARYLALRIARIYPLHLLTALPFALWLLWTQGAQTLPRSLLNLALLQSWVPDPQVYFSLNEPSWSLSDELFFYTAFVPLARLAPRRLATVAGLLAAGVGALIASRIALGNGAIAAAGAPTLTHWLAYINPLTRGLDFVLGMLLYRAPRPVLSARAATALECAAPALLLVLMGAATTGGWPPALRLQLLYLPAMALIIHTYAGGGGAISRWLSARWLVLLGDASFALYMIHLPLLHGGWALYQGAGEPIPLGLYAAAITLVCVVLSVLTYRLLEAPLQRRLRAAINQRFAIPRPSAARR